MGKNRYNKHIVMAVYKKIAVHKVVQYFLLHKTGRHYVIFTTVDGVRLLGYNGTNQKRKEKGEKP